MATSESSGDNGSGSTDAEKASGLLCEPCQSDGRELEAVGYCVTCWEKLCAKCYKYHRRPTAMRKHVLMDMEQMSREQSEKKTDICADHDDRPVEYHCNTHAFHGCGLCFYQHQKTCKDAKHISEVAKDIVDSETFRDFTAKLESIAKSVDDLRKEAQRNLKGVKQNHKDTLSALQAFKSSILDTIEKLEKELKQKADAFHESQTARLEETISRCAAVQAEYEKLTTEINVLRNSSRHGELYIAVNKTRKKLLELEGRVNDMDGGAGQDFMAFEENADLASLLNKTSELGKISRKSIIDRMSSLDEFSVKCTDDSGNACYLLGSNA